MSSLTSTRWRRLAKKHWIPSTTQDTFESLVFTTRLREPLVEVEVRPRRPGHTLFQSSTWALILLILAVGLVLLVRRKGLLAKWQPHQFCKFRSSKSHGQEPDRVDHHQTPTQTYPSSQCTSATPKRTLPVIRRDPARPNGKRRRMDASSSFTDFDAAAPHSSVDPSSRQGEQDCLNAIEQRSLEKESTLVSESTSAPDTVISSVASSDPDMLVSSAISSTNAAVFQREADELARRILVAQGSFSEYGLSPEMAAEFAMKKHFADRSTVSQLQREAIRQTLKERRHQERTSALYYDPDWQSKLTTARDDCCRAVLANALYALALAAVFEIFVSCPSVARFFQVLMDCACGETVVDATNETRGWVNYTYDWYKFLSSFVYTGNRMEEPSYWSSIDNVPTASVFQPFTSFLRYARCLGPYAALLVSAWILRLVGVQLPQVAQNGLLLVWFLHSEFATLGVEALSLFMCYHAVPQLMLGATCFCLTRGQRSETIRAMRSDPTGFQRHTLETSLETFDSLKNWFAALPFMWVLGRALLWCYGWV